MAGDVVASVVFVESSGGSGNCSGDAQTENWDLTRQQKVLNEVNAGLAFWTSRANSPKPLTFRVDNQGVRKTSCEPINRPAGPGDEGLWIADVLSGLGFTASPTNYFDPARRFAASRRAALGADWAYTIFVVDSANDADGAFSNEATGYAYLNGPFAVLTYDNGAWGIDRFYKVLSHETGHIFGAPDEYQASGCSTTSSFGYLSAPNTSCNIGGVTTDVSVMGEGSELDDPNVDVSTSARDALGWRNPAPGTGPGAVVDVVRTSTASLTPYSPDPSPDNTPTFAASAGNTAFPPGSGNAAVSISKVGSAEQSVDSGPFSTTGVVASDGAFNAETEAYSMTPAAAVPPGAHNFRTRSVNNFGFVSPVASDALTIGGTATTLISENFTTSAANFTKISGGTWAVTSGRYVLTAPADNGVSVANSNLSVHNTVITGDFTLTASGSTTPTSSAFNDFSVVFGYRDVSNYYFASFAESNDANTSGIFKVTNGVRSQLADITTLITAGTTYPVKIERQGATIRVYRSGVLAATATDSAYLSGKVGFGSRNDGGAFDDLIVTGATSPAPQAAPAAAGAPAPEAGQPGLLEQLWTGMTSLFSG